MSSSRASAAVGSDRTVRTRIFRAVLFTTATCLMFGTAAPTLGQDTCNGTEKVKIGCKIADKRVKRTTVKLKQGRPDTAYVCRLADGRERTEHSDFRGTAKFRFQYARNERPDCGTGGRATVGVMDRGEFEKCKSKRYTCLCPDPCRFMDVSGFVVQDELNGRYHRTGDLRWDTDATWIEWNGKRRWQGFRDDAGRVAFCEVSDGEPGDGPFDCRPWKEWRGSSRGWVDVNARFECDE